jgi:hypothetical protein
MRYTKLSIGTLLTILILGATIINVFGFLGFNTLTWQEEVKLLDGRVITVTQKRRIDGSNMEREAWLTFKLPEFSNKEIVWHENLTVKILNVYQNKLYVVGIPATTIEYRQYGRPEPVYIGYRFDNAQWVRIPFNEIPVAIYDVNMYPDNMAIARLKRVTISDKIEIFKDDAWRAHQRRIVPNFKSRFGEDH